MTAQALRSKRYQGLQPLSEGGMGELWLGRDVRRQEQVVLKRIRHGQREPFWRHLFQQEAQVMATLSHPNLAKIYDFGVLEDGAPYLVMEYIEGICLGEVIGRGRASLAWPLLGYVALEVLKGLAHAHARGVVHRDLKPPNIMLQANEQAALPRVVLLDFGISWVRTEGHPFLRAPMAQAPPPGASRFYTPPYASPEQVRGDPEGPSSDLFSLGVILYQLTFGVLPFYDKDEQKMRDKVLYRSPDHELRAQNGAPLGVQDAILYDLLAKNPWRRPAFARDIQRELEVYVSPQEAAVEWRRLWEELAPGRQPPAASVARQPAADKAIPVPATQSLVYRLPTLCGRRRERAFLEGRLGAVEEGQGKQMVWLEGVAGVGKSRLAQWLVEWVHETGWGLGLKVAFHRNEGAFGGFAHGLKRHLGLESASREQINAALRSRLGHSKASQELVTGLCELLSPPPQEPQAESQLLESEKTRFRLLFEALVQLSCGRPVLLWLDDLPLADPESFDFLEFMRQEPLSSLLLVATLRPEHAALQSQRMEQLRQGWRPHTLALEPLSRDELSALLDELLPLERESLGALYQRSQGYPLFALQYLLTSSHNQQLLWEPKLRRYRLQDEALASMPEAMLEFWAYRFSALSTRGREAAMVATTLGAEIPTSLLISFLARLEDQDPSSIYELLEHQILRAEGQSLLWHHGLLEEYLAQQLAQQEHAPALYLQAAQALQAHPQAHSRGIVRLRVRRLLDGGRPDDAFALLLSFVQSEWRIRRDGALLSDDLQLLDGQVSAANQALWWRWKAEAAYAHSDFQQTIAALEQAYACLLDFPDPAKLAHCKRIEALLLYTQGIGERAEALAHEALETFNAHDDLQGQAESRLLLALSVDTCGRYHEAQRWTLSALSCFQRLGQSRGAVHCYAHMGFLASQLGHFDEAQRWLARALSESEHSGDLLSQAHCRFLQSWLALYQHQHELSRELLDAAAHLFDALDERWWSASSLILRGHLAFHQGDPQATLALGRQVVERFSSMGLQHEVGQGLLLQACGCLLRGELHQASSILMEIEGLHRHEALLLQPLALIRAWHAQLSQRRDAACGHFIVAHGFWLRDGLTAYGVPGFLRQISSFGWPMHVQTDLETWLEALRNPLHAGL